MNPFSPSFISMKADCMLWRILITSRYIFNLFEERPTFLDAVESPLSKHRLEGKSLMPLIKGEDPKNWKPQLNFPFWLIFLSFVNFVLHAYSFILRYFLLLA